MAEWGWTAWDAKDTRIAELEAENEQMIVTLEHSEWTYGQSQAELSRLKERSHDWGKLMNELLDERDEFEEMLKIVVQDSNQYYCGQTYEDIFAELRIRIRESKLGRESYE